MSKTLAGKEPAIGLLRLLTPAPVLALLLLFALPQTASARTVVLDPGHGGKDPGAVGPSGYREKDANLDIALRAHKLLTDASYSVIITRSDDSYPTLQQRVQMANQAKADIFVSIHNNSSLGGMPSGTMTLHHSSSAEGRRLATLIHEEVVKRIGLPDLGLIERDELYVLRNTTMPAALLEGAFLNNPQEEELLKSPDFRQRIAEGVVSGIFRYFGDVRLLADAAVSPSLFTPDRDGVTDIASFRYRLERAARVTIRIYGAKGEVKTLALNQPRPAGEVAEGWTGANNQGRILRDGNYRYTITASDGNVTLSSTGIVALQALPQLKLLGVSPNPMSPNGDGEADASIVEYNLDRRAKVTLKVYNYKGEVRTVAYSEDREAGYRREWWTGTDASGRVLPDGNYRFRMTAANSVGVAAVSGVARLDTSPVLSQVEALPTLFSPDGDGSGDITRFCYSLEKPGRVSVTIRDSKGDVRALLRDQPRSGRSYACEAWTGTNRLGKVLPSGTYRFIVSARGNGAPNTVTGVVAVRSNVRPSAVR